MELKEAVQALSEYSKDEVSSALHESNQAIWQHIHDVGFSLANERAKTKLLETETKLTEALTGIEERDRRITDIEAKQPDLEAERQTHRTAVEKLEAKHTQKVADLEGKLGQEQRRGVLQELTLELKNLNPVYAEVAAERAMKRITIKEDGSREVMQESQIPFVASNGKSPVQLLAAEIISSAPKELVLSKVDRGSGGTDGDQQRGAEAPKWDALRTSAKEASQADNARQQKVSEMFTPRGG